MLTKNAIFDKFSNMFLCTKYLSEIYGAHCTFFGRTILSVLFLIHVNSRMYIKRIKRYDVLSFKFIAVSPHIYTRLSLYV